MTPMTIQILRRLKQSEVWRFVGCVSTVVGLLCYALSSPFNRLFGEWSWLKIFLYSVFSFIICSMTLFAKKWQHSQSLLSKAHVAVLVLTATSVYSFFYDKAVNGRPDAYSLISSAAFAVMSLSLSRQTHFGFEVDMLYFFLGCLMMQLIKINLLLAIVGVCFSYSLISLRSSLDATPEGGYGGVQDQGQQHVIDIVSQQQANATGSAGFMAPLTAFTEALQHKNSDLIAMLLKQVSQYIETGDGSDELVTDYNFLVIALPSETINELHHTAKFMVDHGLEKECREAYSSCRREFLDKCLFGLLGVEESIFKENKREWQVRLISSGRWIRVLNVALRILFPCEWQLCNCVFLGFSAAVNLCFIEICREAIIFLLNFADGLVSGSPSISGFSKMRNVFESLYDLIPAFKSFFHVYSVNEAITTESRLAEAVDNLLVNLMYQIFHIPELDVTIPADGGIHPMTKRFMLELPSLCRRRLALGLRSEEYPEGGADGVRMSSSLSMHFVSSVELLEKKLKAKSEISEDHALRYFFMMNNMSYIQQQAKKFEWGTLFGDDWIQNNTAKVRQNLELYQRSSWDKMLDLLNLDSNESVASIVAAESMKKKLKLFNEHFREMCTVQSTWFVPDKQLREQIRNSLENILLPAYGNFIGRLQDALGKQAYENIKYGMFEIEAQLSHLFLGSKQKNQ